ncbi:CPBP family intramembrane metalloprotease [Bacillus shivajii]|uniref:CPBP family intramembrane glutamic endopeptidase n=1 Tax=Bacillus shivajii TaxID=1983719 RepID=UPI001CFB4F25|nr:CPBP family intramembrane glutamic endopeptidase [Bacillus shivajii]UCZ53617.1 CPBP family intramembrane metalloprotease [Bacillus shivajii]
MKTRKPWRSFLIFILLGFIGSLTLLPMSIELIKVQSEEFGIDLGMPAEQLALLTLVNPLILILVATAAGHILAKKVQLTSFIYEKDLYQKPFWSSFKPTIKLGIVAGVAVGVFLILTDAILSPWLPDELSATNEFPGFFHILSGVLYGGIVEEIMMRWGVMTLLVWLIWRIFQRKKEAPTPTTFWVAILFSSFVFAVGHYGATAATTTVTTIVYIRMLLLNGVAGVVFSWLFWKKGLETAMVAHIFTHLTMGLISYLLFFI